jgi:hypothetical protein
MIYLPRVQGDTPLWLDSDPVHSRELDGWPLARKVLYLMPRELTALTANPLRIKLPFQMNPEFELDPPIPE